MKRRLSFRAVIWTAFAAVVLLSLTAGAEAVQQEIKKIRLYDNCEPTSFNAALGLARASVTALQPLINLLRN